MSGDLGKPVLIAGPAELWLLAHVTPFGVQPTLYNFRSIREGVAFCAEHDETPALELEGRRLRPREIRLLLAIADGVDSIGKAAKVTHAGRAQAAGSAVVLIDAGWITAEACGAGKRTRLRLTPAGSAIVGRIRAS